MNLSWKKNGRKIGFYFKVAGLFFYVIFLIIKDFLFANKRPIFLGLIILFSLAFLGIGQIKPKTIPKPALTATPIPLYQDFHLLIPSLDINAPIIADVDGTDKNAYFKALEDGVAHFRGTAKPGEGSNIFIFGHSSFYLWKPGNYKEIFKNLEDIKKDDEIILWYKSKEYKYKVSETQVVSPDETSVLSPTPQEQVTLMTCVPPGTTLHRLIVIGKPIPH